MEKWNYQTFFFVSQIYINLTCTLPHRQIGPKWTIVGGIFIVGVLQIIGGSLAIIQEGWLFAGVGVGMLSMMVPVKIFFSLSHMARYSGLPKERSFTGQ